LSQFLHPRANRLVVLDVLGEQSLVCLPIEAPLSCVNTCLAKVPVEAPGKKETRSPTPAHTLDDSLLQEVFDPRPEEVGDRATAMYEIDDQEVVGAERSHAFVADLLEEPQELRIADLAPQREPHRMGVRSREVGQRLALANALPKNKVESLTGALYQATFPENLGDASIPRTLLPEHIFR
jgi:hypothetical protein